MYRILIVRSKRDNRQSLFQFLTEKKSDGEFYPVEIEDDETMETTVAHMLNEDGYSKDDFIVVKVIDYTIDAVDFSQDEAEQESEDYQEVDDSNDENNE